MKYTYLFLLVLLASCSRKEITPLHYDKPMLVVGNGGGFTGRSTLYYIYENGDVYLGGGHDTTYVKVGHLDKSIAKQSFDMYSSLGFDKMNLNDPGNRYYFISMKKDGKEHKIQWGNSPLEDNRLKIYHDNFMNLIKKIDVQHPTH